MDDVADLLTELEDYIFVDTVDDYGVGEDAVSSASNEAVLADEESMSVSRLHLPTICDEPTARTLDWTRSCAQSQGSLSVKKPEPRQSWDDLHERNNFEYRRLIPGLRLPLIPTDQGRTPSMPYYYSPLLNHSPIPAFSVVNDPKRVFSIGCVFKTVWTESGSHGSYTSSTPGQALVTGHTQQPRSSDPSLVDGNNRSHYLCCVQASRPATLAGHPASKVRWFVVVRKRHHHSLCFAMPAFGDADGGGSTSSYNSATAAAAATTTNTPKKKTSRSDRPGRFVVIYPGPMPASSPEEEGEDQNGCKSEQHSLDRASNKETENVVMVEVAGWERERARRRERAPDRYAVVDIILESCSDQAVPPVRRPVDCSRVYTVEHSQRVMKVGRVHPDFLRMLERSYRLSVR